jgi:hypothetical protein
MLHRVPSVSGEQATALRNAAEILCALSPLPPLDLDKPLAKGHAYTGRLPSAVIGIPVKRCEFEQVRAMDGPTLRNWRPNAPRALPTTPHTAASFGLTGFPPRAWASGDAAPAQSDQGVAEQLAHRPAHARAGDERAKRRQGAVP